MLPGAGGQGKWVCFNGYRVPVLQDKKVLEIGCTKSEYAHLTTVHLETW